MKMLKSQLFIAITAVAASLSTTAMADTSYYEASVLESNPIYRNIEISTPHQECWQEEVVRNERHRQRRSRTPSLLGAVIGGAIGNAVGHHKRNRQVGTVVGAIIGASVGSDISRSNAANNSSTVYYDTVERCRTVYDIRQEEKIVGYNVLYSYNGGEHSVRMPQEPGATVRLRVNVEPVF